MGGAWAGMLLRWGLASPGPAFSLMPKCQFGVLAHGILKNAYIGVGHAVAATHRIQVEGATGLAVPRRWGSGAPGFGKHRQRHQEQPEDERESGHDCPQRKRIRMQGGRPRGIL